jgi:dihydrofolate synthase / folylpolyglutamate synthase
MQFIPVKTRIMNPLQDDLFSVINEYLAELQEGDVVLISSKVVAIHQGRCLPINSASKKELVESEAEFVISREYYVSPLTVTKHAFLGAAGIDESNGDGHYILLPENIFEFAKEAHKYLTQKFKLKNLGVVITDSHSGPFRYGATGVALGWWGIEPMEDHRGRKDLFGREIKYERSNLVDGLSAGAVVVSGEVDECVPIVIAREVPRLIFTTKNTKDKLFVPYKEDLFRVLYEKFLPKD